MQAEAISKRHHRHRLLDCLAVGACLFLSSCFGGSSDVATGEVLGMVTLDGATVPGVMVTFQSDSGFGASANVNDDGTFTVTSQHGDGVPVGHYQVAVVPAVPLEADPLVTGNDETSRSIEEEQLKKIPSRYHDSSTSGLSAEISEGTNNVVLDLTSDAG